MLELGSLTGVWRSPSALAPEWMARSNDMRLNEAALIQIDNRVPNWSYLDWLLRRTVVEWNGAAVKRSLTIQWEGHAGCYRIPAGGNEVSLEVISQEKNNHHRIWGCTAVVTSGIISNCPGAQGQDLCSSNQDVIQAHIAKLLRPLLLILRKSGSTQEVYLKRCLESIALITGYETKAVCKGHFLNEEWDLLGNCTSSHKNTSSEVL